MLEVGTLLRQERETDLSERGEDIAELIHAAGEELEVGEFEQMLSRAIVLALLGRDDVGDLEIFLDGLRASTSSHLAALNGRIN